MPAPIPTNRRADTRQMSNEGAGSGLSQFRSNQAGLLGPMNEIMGEKDEAQKGKDGVELTGTHRLDVEDVTRGGEKGFNGAALIVELKSTLHGKLVGRQVGVEPVVEGNSSRQTGC